MKRLHTTALALLLALSLSACGSSAKTSTSETAETKPVESQASSAQETAVASAESAQSESADYEITSSKAVTWVDSIGSPWVQIITEISNTGTKNLYLSTGACDLEDSTGALVASESMVSAYPDVLAPGEKGYLYEETILDAPVDGELTVVPREDVKEAKVELIRFPVTDDKISTDNYGNIKMLGRIENTSGAEQKMIYIVAFLYDANNSCIGQMFTITDSLAAGEKAGFEMSSMSLPKDITADSIDHYVVYAYPTQYQF